MKFKLPKLGLKWRIRMGTVAEVLWLRNALTQRQSLVTAVTLDELELSRPSDFWLAHDKEDQEISVNAAREFSRVNRTSVILGKGFNKEKSKSRSELKGLADQFESQDWEKFERDNITMLQEPVKLFVLNNASLDISEAGTSISSKRPKVTFGENFVLDLEKWGGTKFSRLEKGLHSQEFGSGSELPANTDSIYFSPWYALKQKKWYNYGNWLSQVLTRYAVAVENFPHEFIFVLPPNPRPWHRTTLLQLGLPERRIIDWPGGSRIKLRTFLIATDGSSQGNLGAEGFILLRRIIQSRFCERVLDPGNRFCLSRAGVEHRWSSTTLKLEGVFRDFGFDVIKPETMRISEQWTLGANNSTFGGIFGSNLMTGLLSPRGSRIFEAMSIDQVAWRTPHWFWQLAGFSDIDYHRYIYSEHTFSESDFAVWLEKMV